MKHYSVLFFLILLLNLPILSAQAASAYKITDLGYGYSGNINNSASVPIYFSHTNQVLLYNQGKLTNLNISDYNAFTLSINNSNQITSSSFKGFAPGANLQHAFIYSHGQFQDIGTLGGYFSHGSAINDNGQITGSSSLTLSDFSPLHAFLYSKGKMQDLGTLGGTNSRGHGINAAGEVVGSSNITNDTVDHAFLYEAGKMTDLGTLILSETGLDFSFANALNDKGQITGSSGDTYGEQHAFLYNNGIMQDIGTLPGYLHAAGEDINNNGQIVGRAFDPSSSTGHAFLYENGQMTDLNSLIAADAGWTLATATGINDLGQIVGTGSYGFGPYARTFILTPSGLPIPPTPTPIVTPPVPLPAGVWLFVSALFGMKLLYKSRFKT
jgi:probable HAF family extracellular repeat protein